MSGLVFQTVLRELLAKAGVTAQGDPGRYDQLQRDAERWWAAGGSMRSFADAVKAGADTSVLSHQEARRICERRFAPAWMRP